MSAYNKRKGATFETSVLKWLRSIGFTAERLSRAGSKDEGDIVVIVSGKNYILELKATKKLDLPGFWEEATVEAENYAKARNMEASPPRFVIVKRRKAGIDKAWVIEDFKQWSERTIQ